MSRNRGGWAMSRAPVTGFVGLGSMGSVLAANLVGAGHDVVAYDVAGPGRRPEGAAWADGTAEVARRADVVVLSLPDGRVSAAVLEELLASGSDRLALVVQTSTIGVGSGAGGGGARRGARQGLRRRPGVGWDRRRPVPHAHRHGRGVRRGVGAGRADDRRAQRPASPRG